MLLALPFILLKVLQFVSAGNNTVTDEVYFDVEIMGSEGEEPWMGRFVVGVFGDVLPITTFNFVNLAKGFQHRKEVWTYEYSLIHRVVPDFLLQMGDVVYKDGRGGRSIYAPYFIDEGFIHSHQARGFVAMANAGVDTNNSQFYITLTTARWLDQKNVVFGKVIAGMDVIERIGKVETEKKGRPLHPVTILKCGLRELTHTYDLTHDELRLSSDVRR